AEDGIRDRNVTGVQTCALPISESGIEPALQARLLTGGGHGHLRVWRAVWFLGTFRSRPFLDDVECAVSRSVSTVVMSSCHPGGTTSQATTGGRMCGAYSTDGRRGGRDGGRQTGKDRGSTGRRGEHCRDRRMHHQTAL